MLIGMRNAMLAGGGDLSAKSYVQDGLIAMWDGIENAGWGVHDASATTWTDLIGSADLAAVGTPTINADSVSFDGTSCFYKNSLSISEIATVEYCGYRQPFSQQINTSDPELIRVNGSMQAKLYGVRGGDTTTYGISNVGAFWNKRMNLLAGSTATWIINTSPMQEYYNGVYFFDWSQNRQLTNVTEVVLGAGSSGLFRSSLCTVHCVRLYNRTLTAAEIAANYAVDKARFNLA